MTNALYHGAEPTYVFIAGYMHSGTSVLGGLIANLPGALPLRRESKFLEFLPRYRLQFPNLSDPVQADGLDEQCRRLIARGFRFKDLKEGRQTSTTGSPSASGDYLDRFLGVVDEVLSDADSRLFVEHTGTNVFGYQELADSVKRVFMVEIVRDPRDVLASKKTRRASVNTGRYAPEKRARKNLEKAFDPIWDAVSWRSFVRAGARASEQMPDRYLRLRYEDVVADPDEALRAVGSLVGIAPSGSPVQVNIHNAADRAVRRSSIDARSVGRWRGVLSDEEASAIERITRTELAELQYPISDLAVSASKMVRLIGRSTIEPGLRISRRFRLGGAVGGRTFLTIYVRRLVRARSTR